MIEPNKSISIATIISQLTTCLCKAYCNEQLCQQYAWWVLESITGKSKSDLILKEHISLNEHQTEKISDWIDQQVSKNIPLQYLIGSVPFISCDILVEPPILIPRPETEWWVAQLIEQLKTVKKPLNILDLCTGSGCIAVALAKELPEAHITACDICPHALQLAKHNAQHNNVTVNYIESDLFTNITGTFDIIISNPPYVSAQEYKVLDASVKNWEDSIALLAPDNGLGIIKEIAQLAKKYINPLSPLKKEKIPQLYIEIGYDQGIKAQALLKNAQFTHISVLKDLHNKDRVVTAQLLE